MDRGFRAWATPAGLESFYIKECRTERPKDELVAASEPYHFYYVHAFDHDGQFLRVQENESLAHLRIDGGGGVVCVGLLSYDVFHHAPLILILSLVGSGLLCNYYAGLLHMCEETLLPALDS